MHSISAKALQLGLPDWEPKNRETQSDPIWQPCWGPATLPRHVLVDICITARDHLAQGVPNLFCSKDNGMFRIFIVNVTGSQF